jgi:hypothetical protein
MIANPIIAVQPILDRWPVTPTPQRVHFWKSPQFTGTHCRPEAILAQVRGNTTMKLLLVDIERRAIGRCILDA